MMWLILATVAVAGVMLVLRQPATARLAERAITTGDLEPLVDHVAQEPESTRPTVFDQATRTLWDRFERPLAARFVRQSAEFVATATITQYWIRQMLEVEPDIANDTFDSGFLGQMYDPELAARCGKKG